MSLDVRHLTNGEKEIYAIRDFGELSIYNSIDEIPQSIRHYAENTELVLAKPDLARILGVLDVLYPNFPNCGMEDYKNKKCIAEGCKYAPNGEWEKCPYFKK